MPQTLSGEWEVMLGDDASSIHEKWLHTVGNLTLTGYNSELGNAPFLEKRTLLGDSKFALTGSVLNSDVWNEETIECRGKLLAERALKIWSR